MEEFALFIKHAATKFNPPIGIGDIATRYAGALHAVIFAIAAAGVVLHPKLGVLVHHKIYVGLLLIVFQIDFDMLRTRRGFGVYGTFRFTESPYSYGEIRGGVFDNFSRAQKRLEYKNERHHGFEVQYDRSKRID